MQGRRERGRKRGRERGREEQECGHALAARELEMWAINIREEEDAKSERQQSSQGLTDG